MKSFHRFRTLVLSSVALIALGVTIVGVHADGGANHQARQTRPIQLGTSGGSIDDLRRRGPFVVCCGGTLGSVVEDAGGAQYVLSNNHVLARKNLASIGEDVVHPGLIDVNCSQISSDVVADLSNFVPLDFSGAPNLVDAAIAQVRPGAVDSSGAILDIGALSPTPLAATPGILVQKSGRTSGQTTAQVSDVNATVNVGYSQRCGDQPTLTAQFVNQILTTALVEPGDSGSMLLSQGSPAQAVGLLYAGSDTLSAANQIGDVLSAFNVSLVGGDPPPTGTISGTVTNANDGTVIAGATVVVDATGQDDTTDANGNYTIPDVATGNHAVTASATGFDSQTENNVAVNEDQTTIVDFALTPTPPPPPGGNAVVDCVTYDTFGGSPSNRKHLRVAVRVVDGSDAPISGANVTILLSPGGTRTATTDGSGWAVFEEKNAADTCYGVDVTEIALSGSTVTDPAEPANGFLKNTDATPDNDCRSGSDACGTNTAGTTLSRGRGLTRASRAKVQAAAAAKSRHEHGFFLLSDDVVAVGVGARSGEAVINVYLSSVNPAVLASLPAQVDGVPVVASFSGQFVAGGVRRPGTNATAGTSSCQQ